MRLRHYSASIVNEVQSRGQEGGPRSKPNGLWVSDATADSSWRNYCERNGRFLDTLEHCYDVLLAPDARILVLGTMEKVYEFTEAFIARPDNPGLKTRPQDRGGTLRLCWGPVAEKYQGIILTPYFHELRNDLQCLWYTTWECAGGCIWDAAAIRFFTLSEE